MKNRLKGILAIAIMLMCCCCAAVFYGMTHRVMEHNTYDEMLVAAPMEAESIQYINDDFTVDEKFSSHLPLVVIDTNGEEPPIYLKRSDKKRFILIEDIEQYVDGTISIINNPDGINRLTDVPEVTSDIRIKRRGNSSMFYEKAQWLVKLVTASGQDNDLDLLGMGEEHEWILNGSMFDKSLLRNYLSYSIASEVMEYTPDSKYCEVLVRIGDSYSYQGVYLLMENIKQGPDRVDIAEYKTGDVFNSYLLRRDRLDEEAITLDTYARENGFSSEYFSVIYPTKYRITEDMIMYIQEDINAVERILYSQEPNIFITYGDVIDVDSFVDYFLLNEFLISYDAGNFSTYCYKDKGGKLCMGPVWDFDGTMDNYVYESADLDKLAFQTKPWFDCLCTDLNFVKKMEERYTELRKTTFSDEHVIGKIDEIVAHLGGAQERDWYRWGHWYTTENIYSLWPEQTDDGEIVICNATTYQDEIYRIKVALREHGQFIPEELRILEKSTKVTSGLEKWMGLLLFFAACIFIIPAAFVSLRK